MTNRDPLADVLRTAADLDTAMNTWEWDFTTLARVAREFIAAEIEAAAVLPPFMTDPDGYPERKGMRRAAKIARGEADA